MLDHAVAARIISGLLRSAPRLCAIKIDPHKNPTRAGCSHQLYDATFRSFSCWLSGLLPLWVAMCVGGGCCFWTLMDGSPALQQHKNSTLASVCSWQPPFLALPGLVQPCRWRKNGTGTAPSADLVVPLLSAAISGVDAMPVPALQQDGKHRRRTGLCTAPSADLVLPLLASAGPGLDAMSVPHFSSTLNTARLLPLCCSWRPHSCLCPALCNCVCVCRKTGSGTAPSADLVAGLSSTAFFAAIHCLAGVSVVFLVAPFLHLPVPVKVF